MKRIMSLALILCVAFAMPALAVQERATSASAASGNALTVSADSLGGLVIDRSIKLMTRDGTYIEGRVVQASRETITLEVKKSEPKVRVRGGEASIRTSDISVVHMSKGGPVGVPIVFGILGGFAGGLAAGYAAATHSGSEAGAFAAGLAGIASGATGGALLGRAAVKKTVTINVAQPSQRGLALEDGSK